MTLAKTINIMTQCEVDLEKQQPQWSLEKQSWPPWSVKGLPPLSALSDGRAGIQG